MIQINTISLKKHMPMEITNTANLVFLENNIDYQDQLFSSQKLQALLLSHKAQKKQDSSFYCKQVQEMPTRTLPEAYYIKVKVTRGKYCQDFVIKNKNLVINKVTLF